MTSIQEIERDLEVCHGSTQEMVSSVLGALDCAMAGLSERKRDLHKIEYALDQAKAKIRELMTRSKGVGVKDPLSTQKQALAGLRHMWQDLQSDLEAVEHFHLNFKGRSVRLNGGE